MNRLADLKALFPKFAAAAQEVYDLWEQDENGEDPDLGAGGICDDVASEIATVLSNAGIDAGTLHIDSDNHTVVIAAVDEGVFHIDIPFSHYERQNGYYDYTKIPDVVFTPDMVVCEKIDADPTKLDTYLEI